MKRTLLLAAILLVGALDASKALGASNMLAQDSPIQETNIVQNPTKKQLTGVWQACTPDDNGTPKLIPVFKLLGSDGTFQNLLLHNVKTLQFTLGTTGTWKVKDGKLVETVDKKSNNPFAGKSNPMELTLSNGGHLMHIVWISPQTGMHMHEFYMKVE